MATIAPSLWLSLAQHMPGVAPASPERAPSAWDKHAEAIKQKQQHADALAHVVPKKVSNLPA